MHLSHLEAQAARALATAGFPVLRYHGQGYGDSERGMEAIGLRSHLADAADALGLLRSMTRIEQVGALGARFGGTVAALTAAAYALPFLILWEPVVRGDRLLRDHRFSSAISTMLGGRAPSDGFAPTEEAVGEIAGLDLLQELHGFRGTSLLLHLSRPAAPNAPAASLAGHLRSLGGDVTVDSIPSPGRAEFGQFHLRSFPGRKGKADVRADVDRALVRATVRWCLTLGDGGER
jgi:pimeloyl-ACP methyl ester carboxylesterase